MVWDWEMEKRRSLAQQAANTSQGLDFHGTSGKHFRASILHAAKGTKIRQIRRNTLAAAPSTSGMAA
jgi:hypothetical protein